MIHAIRQRRLGARLAMILATVAVPGWAHATSGVDCKAVNQGALNVDLGSTASDTRSVMLRSGQALKFTFRAEPGPFGTLTLLAGAGSPRVLLVGPTGTSVSFAAAGGGSFSFQFTREGEDPASFTVSCMPARSVRRGTTRSSVLRRDTVPLGDSGVTSEALHMAEPAGVDPGAPRPPQDGKAPLGGDAAIPLPKQIGGAEMKLQWRSERYAAAGPEGPEIDANASGVEIGVNYKVQSAVQIGALAQFDPAAEMLFGGQRSLSDHGWMAGPVTTVHFAPGLVLDARAAWGIAESSAEDFTGVGAGAQRRLLSARLANPQTFGAWRFTPSVNFSHLQEFLHSPAPTVTEVPAQHTVGFGRVDVGPELAYRIDLPQAAFIEPRAVLGGFWGFDSLSKLAPGAGGYLEPRLKAEAGVTIGIVDGVKLQATSGVEGGGGGTPDAWTGRLQLSVPLK